MSLLFRVIYATHTRSTHHKIALDSLQHLQCENAERWRRLFLKHHAVYLKGAKDPDVQFRDFCNHVLHVEQNYWGGAPKKAWQWYYRAVEAFQSRAWADGVYAAGVLSHYYTDPIQPFHTAQSEKENNIHRAAEWSITKSYRALWKQACGSRLPEVRVPDCDDWLEVMVRDGAERANRHYETLIDHYDFARGVKHPPRGLDERSRDILSGLIGYAVVGFSHVLDRLFYAAKVTPPPVGLTVKTFLSTLTMPVQWVTKKMADGEERRLVEDMYRELQRTGRVEKNLPEEDRVVREQFGRHLEEKEREAAERRRAQQAAVETHVRAVVRPRPAPQETLRYYLDLESNLVDAPSIGPKTAERFAMLNIHTVGDFLNLQPEQGALMMNARHITAAVISAWQDQAKLVCSIPNLRGHDAQILVACGVRNPAALLQVDRQRLLQAIAQFAQTKEGQYVIRSGKQPDAQEVDNWVRWAKQARRLQAA